MLSNFGRYPLTFGPTPIERLSRLTAHLGGDVEIFAKREDCNSGLAFGGNKLRKLEYIEPDSIASNADTLVSIGEVQSNHTRLVAAAAAELGMKCRLIQESWFRTKTPSTTGQGTSCSHAYPCVSLFDTCRGGQRRSVVGGKAECAGRPARSRWCKSITMKE